MANQSVRTPLARAGAREYLFIWATALNVQETRLLYDPLDQTVDVWFALIALRNGLRALDLAVKVARDPAPVRETIARFQESKAAKQIRNVFEHFDSYFIGGGNLQKANPDAGPETFAPHIETTFSEGEVSIDVRVGEETLEIPETTSRLRDVLHDVRKLLEE